MTFVLGLVSEPPATQYLANYSGNPREKAVISGTKMVEQFNCTGCHQLDFERGMSATRRASLASGASRKITTSCCRISRPSRSLIRKRKIVAADACATLRSADGKRKGRAARRPRRTKKAIRLMAAGLECASRFGVIRCLPVRPWLVGGKMPLVPRESRHGEVRRPWRRFGTLDYPTVVADEQKVNPNAKADEAWGWLPPPLVGEGKKCKPSGCTTSCWSRSKFVRRRAADAEIQYEFARSKPARELLRCARRRAGAVRIRRSHEQRLPVDRRSQASQSSGRRAENRDRQ